MQSKRDSIEASLRSIGVRMTPARQAVVAALEVTEGPVAAQDLHPRLDPPVPLSSLYRSLSVLSESGVLASHHGSDGVVRFEFAEWLTGHHHHLICSSCGDIADVEVPVANEERLEKMAQEIASRAGFLSTGHSLEIEGTCRSCA